jgi:hypothetical protein
MIKIKSKKVPVWELSEKEAGEYEPTFLDLWDDLPSHIRKYYSLDKVEKEIRGIKKWHKLQDRQKRAAQAKRVAKKLKEKHPKWTNTKIINHASVRKFLDKDMRDRSKRRILKSILPPGKPGRPINRKSKKHPS